MYHILEMSYDPAVSLLVMYLEKNMMQKDTCTLMFIEALFTIAKTYKQPKRPSTEEWMKAFTILDHLEWCRVAAALGPRCVPKIIQASPGMERQCTGSLILCPYSHPFSYEWKLLNSPRLLREYSCIGHLIYQAWELPSLHLPSLTSKGVLQIGFTPCPNPGFLPIYHCPPPPQIHIHLNEFYEVSWYSQPFMSLGSASVDKEDWQYLSLCCWSLLYFLPSSTFLIVYFVNFI